MPRLSIHIATKDNGRFIADAIASVLADPFPDKELLIFDDGSTDSSWPEIHRAIDGHPNAKAFRTMRSLGVAKARQRLLETCDAEFIMPVDGDDLLLSGTIEKRLAILSERKDLAGVYGKLRHIAEDGRPMPSLMGCSFSRFNLPYENMVCHGGQILRRADVLSSGGYQETGAGAKSLAIDLSLWFRIALEKDLLFVNDFVYLYRQRAGQLTKSGPEHYLNAQRLIMKETLDARPELSSAISKCQRPKLDSSSFRAATLIAAIYSRCVPASSPAFAWLLDFASDLSPEDYGIDFRLLSSLPKNADSEDVITLCNSIIAKAPSDPFIKLSALKFKLKKLDGSGVSFERDALLESIREADAEYSLPNPSAP